MRRLRFLLTDSRPPVWYPPPWRRWLALALSLLALGISIYLTLEHYVGKQLLACPAGGGGAINCEHVLTSGVSVIVGVPVAVLGLAFYVAMTGLNLPWAWRSEDRRVHLARLVLVAVGMVFALYLIAAEVLVINNICLWCTGVHILTFALLVLLTATTPPMLGLGAPGRGGTVPAQSTASGGRGGRGRRSGTAAGSGTPRDSARGSQDTPAPGPTPERGRPNGATVKARRR